MSLKRRCGQPTGRSGTALVRVQSWRAWGTTVCVAGLTGVGSRVVVNVGDSRACVLRNGSLRQLTDDHSVTAQLVRRGELSEQEAPDHPLRGVLTRALGVGPDVEIDSAAHPAVEGDRLLVCTDGLFNEVPTTRSRL
jgi:PPM family protein phosphatase